MVLMLLGLSSYHTLGVVLWTFLTREKNTELIGLNFSPFLKILINDRGWSVQVDRPDSESCLCHLLAL